MLFGDATLSITSAFRDYPEFARHAEKVLIEYLSSLPCLSQQPAAFDKAAPSQPPLQQPQPQSPVQNVVSKLQASSAATAERPRHPGQEAASADTSVSKPLARTSTPAHEKQATPIINNTNINDGPTKPAPSAQLPAAYSTTPAINDGYAPAMDDVAIQRATSQDIHAHRLSVTEKDINKGNALYDWSRKRPRDEDYCVKCAQLKTQRPSSLAAGHSNRSVV